jgi:hypothetical protein
MYLCLRNRNAIRFEARFKAARTGFEAQKNEMVWGFVFFLTIIPISYNSSIFTINALSPL